MATQNNSFTRSNVNAQTLNVSDPQRSSFNLSHKVNLTMPIGRCVPVQMEPLMPSDVLQGSVSPELQFEKIMTPQIGPVRLDTHTFVVNMRRINKDFKNGLSDDKPTIPVFTYKTYFDFFFGMLILAGWNSTTGQYLNSVPTGSNLRQPVFSLAAFAFPASKSSEAPKTLKAASQHIYQVLYIGCRNLLVSTANSKFNYRKDSVLTYMQYLENSPWFTPTSAAPDSDPLNFVRSLLYLVKPFFGEGSLFDYLGYPVFTEYSAFFDSIRDYVETGQGQYSSLFVTAILHQFDKTYTETAVDVFDLFTSKFVTASGSIQLESLDLPGEFSELPLRAYYACWFDYLRNWHIEGRNDVLNPDNFGNSVLLSDEVVSRLLSFAVKVNSLAVLWSLLDLQYRNYTTDFLNSIQTDDNFRHVYSPVIGTTSIGGSTEVEYIPVDGQSAPYSADNISILTFPKSVTSEYFPSGLSSLVSGVGTDSSELLYQDLQTMRRAGMLEKWLARNYYFPDNYVGRVQARFGIKPSDYNVLLSTYIGGSEQFISGDQKVANVGTDQTPVGQRTMVANAASSDSYSYQSSDWGFLVSMVSLVPIVNYDIAHPATLMSMQQDFPAPEYATDARFEARTADFLRGFSIKPCIGYVPRYYLWRVRGDETHGRYLTDLRSYSWFKDWYSMFFGSADDKNLSTTFVNHEFSLTPYHLRVHVSLDAFLGLNDWDSCAFGSVNVGLSINRPLPAAVEYI